MQLGKGPIIKRDFGNIIRIGRGYSIGELLEAGINPRLARNSNIPLDRLRKSAHKENIEQLGPIAKKIKESRIPKPKASAATSEKTKSKKKSKPK